MLTMTPEYAAQRERKARETVEWLEGKYDLKPLRAPVVARLELRKPVVEAPRRKPRKPSTRAVERVGA